VKTSLEVKFKINKIGEDLMEKITQLIAELKYDFRASLEPLKSNRENCFLIEGEEAIIGNLKDIIPKVRSSLVLYTPQIIPDLLHVLSEHAYMKKGTRFMLAAHIDFETYGIIIEKLTALGNIQFRDIPDREEHYYCNYDGNALLLGKHDIDPSKSMALLLENHNAVKEIINEINPYFKSISTTFGAEKAREEKLQKKWRKKYQKLKTDDKMSKFLKKIGMTESELLS